MAGFRGSRDRDDRQLRAGAGHPMRLVRKSALGRLYLGPIFPNIGRELLQSASSISCISVGSKFPRTTETSTFMRFTAFGHHKCIFKA